MDSIVDRRRLNRASDKLVSPGGLAATALGSFAWSAPVWCSNIPAFAWQPNLHPAVFCFAAGFHGESGCLQEARGRHQAVAIHRQGDGTEPSATFSFPEQGTAPVAFEDLHEEIPETRSPEDALMLQGISQCFPLGCNGPRRYKRHE